MFQVKRDKKTVIYPYLNVAGYKYSISYKLFKITEPKYADTEQQYKTSTNK